jgi:hypothetical protein
MATESTAMAERGTEIRNKQAVMRSRPFASRTSTRTSIFCGPATLSDAQWSPISRHSAFLGMSG